MGNTSLPFHYKTQNGGFFKTQNTVKDHYCKVTKMIDWVKDEYLAYFTSAVNKLTEEETEDRMRYNTCIYDFIYQGLNINVTKEFLGKHKNKQDKFTYDGKPVHYSYSHIRKCHDIILFGLHHAKFLPIDGARVQ